MSGDLEVVYVTVGTTKFDELLYEIIKPETLRILQRRNCRKLILQHGNGVPPVVDINEFCENYNMNLEQYSFKFEAVRSDIVAASLVIGHAGAGTCMDILNYNKPGLLVINDKLMDNHQIELACQLCEEGYIYHCNVRELQQTLATLDSTSLKPYSAVKQNMQNFVDYLNQMLDSE